MQPLLVVSLLVSLAVGQRMPYPAVVGVEAGYVHGKEYIYDYETQAITGLAVGSKLFSGLKVAARVRLQIVSSFKVKMEMTNIRVFKFNDMFGERNPAKEMLPLEMMTEITGEDIDTMRLELVKPITFEYIRGHISGLTSEEDEPTWSLNIKRGVLSLLEVNFNERQSLEVNPVPVSSAVTPRVYTVVEPTVAGECETVYRIGGAVPNGIPAMTIQKSRNFNRCIEKVAFTSTMYNGVTCPYCGNDMGMEAVTAQSAVFMTVTGTPTQFLIASAVGEHQYNLKPYSEKGGRVTTFAMQTMTLVTSRPVTDQIPSPSTAKLHTRSIRAEIPEERYIMAGVRPVYKTLDMTEYYEMAKKLIYAIEKMSAETIDPEIGDLLAELHRIAKKLDKPTLLRIIKEFFVDVSKAPNARKIVLEILPTVGTPETVGVLMELLMKEEFRTLIGPKAFVKLALVPRPDVTAVQPLMEFIENTRAWPTPMWKRTAYLCLGALGNKVLKYNNGAVKELASQQALVKQIREQENVKHLRRNLDYKLRKIEAVLEESIVVHGKFVARIVKMVKKLYMTEKIDNKMLAIKTIGNLGFVEFFPVLTEIIANKASPWALRMHAIFCMKNMIPIIPEKIREWSLPLFFDRTELDEVRLAAYWTAVAAKITAPEMEMITAALYDEPSQNVGSFIFKHLTRMSEQPNTCNCIQSNAINSTLALRYGKKFAWGRHYSLYFGRTRYNSKLEMGTESESVIFYSPKERMPRNVYHSFTAAFFGKTARVMECGFTAKGLDSIANKLMRYTDTTSVIAAVKNLVVPRGDRSVVSTEGELQKLIELLKVSPRMPELPEGTFFFAMFGYELFYIDVNDAPALIAGIGSIVPESYSSFGKVIPDMSSVISGIKKLMKTHMAGVFPMMHHAMPTETGLPIRNKVTFVTALKVKGDFNLGVNPRTSAQKSLMSNFNADFDMMTSGLLEMRVEQIVDATIIRSGAAVKIDAHFKLPLMFTTVMDYEKSKFIIKIRDPKPFTMLKFSSTPMTMVRGFPLAAARYPMPAEVKEITAVEGVKIVPIAKEYGKDLLGHVFAVTGRIVLRQHNLAPICPLTGKIIYYVNYKPMVSTGLDIQFQHVKLRSGPVSSEAASAEGGWLSSMMTWFTDSGEKIHVSKEMFGRSSSKGISGEGSSAVNSREAISGIINSGETYSGETYSSERVTESKMGFLNLETKDLTIDYLIRKFRGETEMLTTGTKCGLVMRIAEPGASPRHQVQISTLFQAGESWLTQLQTIEVRHMPKHAIESTPWKMVMNMKMVLPDTIVEPAHLFDKAYQKLVMKQIQVSVSENGQKMDSVIDLGTVIVANAVKQVKMLQRPDVVDIVVRDIVNELLIYPLVAQSSPVREIVQSQIMLVNRAKQLIQPVTDAAKIPQMIMTIDAVLEKSKVILDTAVKYLEAAPRGEKPVISVLVQYVAALQSGLLVKVHKIVTQLRPVMSTTQATEIGSKVHVWLHTLLAVRAMQEQQAVAKQSYEMSAVSFKQGPQEQVIIRELAAIERELIAISQKSQQLIKMSWVSAGVVQPVLGQVVAQRAAIEGVLNAATKVLWKLYSAQMAGFVITRPVQLKALEVVLLAKQTIVDFEALISLNEMLPKPVPARYPYSSSEVFADPNQKEVVILKDTIKLLAAQAARCLATNINAGIERSVITPAMSGPAETYIAALQKAEMKLLLVIGLIKPVSHSAVYILPIEKIASIAVEVITEIAPICNTIIQQCKATGINPVVAPVLIKALKVVAKYSAIVENVHAIIKENIVVLAAKGDPRVTEFKAIAPKIDILTQEAIKLIKYIKVILRVDAISGSAIAIEIPSVYGDRIVQGTPIGLQGVPIGVKGVPIGVAGMPIGFERVSLGKLQMKVHTLQARQLAQKSAIRTLLSILDDPSSGSSSYGGGISGIGGGISRFSGGISRFTGGTSGTSSGGVSGISRGISGIGRGIGRRSKFGGGMSGISGGMSGISGGISGIGGGISGGISGIGRGIGRGYGGSFSPGFGGKFGLGLATKSLFSGKQELYAVLGKIEELQVEIMSGKEAVERAVEVVPRDPRIPEIVEQLKEIIERQKMVVVAIEQRLVKKSGSDFSLHLPIQKVQQLKDGVDRILHQYAIVINRYNQLKTVDAAGSVDPIAAITSASYGAFSSYPQMSWYPARAMRDITAHVTIKFGREGGHMKAILMKIFGKKSIDQLLWEQKQILPLERDPIVTMYLDDRLSADDRMSPVYQLIKSKLNFYRHIHMMCAYEGEMPIILRKFMWRSHERVKHMFYDSLSLVMPDKTNLRNNFEIVAEMEKENKWIDLAIITPYETNRITGVTIPNTCRMYMGPYSEDVIAATSSGVGVGCGLGIGKGVGIGAGIGEADVVMYPGMGIPSIPATCEISGVRIKTLDGKRYEVPMIDQPCQSVLAMDCSPAAKFAVISQIVPSAPSKKIIAVITKQHKVEIIPTGTTIAVRVNGKVIDPMTIRDIDIRPLIIKKVGATIVVTVPHHSLEVITDGYYASVKVKGNSWSKVCGLCGNFDGMPSNDFVGPTMVQYAEAKSFMSSYLVPSAMCDVAGIRDKFGIAA